MKPHDLDSASNLHELRVDFWICRGMREASEIQAMVTLELGGSEVGVCFMLIHAGKHLHFKHFSVVLLFNQKKLKTLTCKESQF